MTTRVQPSQRTDETHEEGGMSDQPVCPLCSSSESVKLLEGHDWKAGRFNQDYAVRRCGACALLYTWPRPSMDTLYEAYNAEYSAHSRGSFFRPVRQPSLLRRLLMSALYLNLRWLPPLPEGSRVLDLGCSTGEFLADLEHTGWERHGVDVSGSAVTTGRYLNGLELQQGRMDGLDFPNAHFDAVLCWHTFEHLYDPKLYLHEIARVLKPGGYFVLALPNAGCWQRSLFKSYWYELHLPYHLHHFTEKRLRSLFNEVCDIEVQQVLYGPSQAQLVRSIGALLAPGRHGARVRKFGRGLMEYMRAPMIENRWMMAVKLLLLPMEYALIPLRQSDEMVFVTRKPVS